MLGGSKERNFSENKISGTWYCRRLSLIPDTEALNESLDSTCGDSQLSYHTLFLGHWQPRLPFR